MSIRTAFDDLRGDASVAWRSLRANPGFTTTVVLSLAVAVGASASAFSVIDAVRFRALPFADADRLIALVPAARAARVSPLTAIRGQ
jgi:hypothetical protein